ncbi:Replication factor C subunit 2 [Aphelenchoides besseyi]|nr:Replication factor C subunit 2 [Aphelenchoides besseyi]KAI6229151.1 Replication factor C subunit 2 [Aphelenchoides besseyi]
MDDMETSMDVDNPVAESQIEPTEKELRKEKLAAMPWLEKYRPRKLEDMVGSEETISRFKYFAIHGNIPHLILSGPPGVGKTTVIHAMAHETLKENFKKAVLELNASDERGLDVVRNRIRVFAEGRCDLPENRHKIIILDEVDSMTEGAQQALRRIMEKYARTTRFMLACNQSNKIIEPIQSRCALIKFGVLEDKEVYRRLVEICGFENLEYVKEGLDAIVFTAQGDMRQAINNLQCTASGYGTITAENVYKVCDESHPADIVAFFEHCAHGEFRRAYSFVEKQRVDGHAFTDMLIVLNRTLTTTDIAEAVRLEFIKILGLTHMDAIKGHSERLQMAGFVAKLCNVHKRLLS